MFKPCEKPGKEIVNKLMQDRELTLVMAGALCSDLIVHPALAGVCCRHVLAFRTPEGCLRLAIKVEVGLASVPFPCHSDVVPHVVRPAVPSCVCHGSSNLQDTHPPSSNAQGCVGKSNQLHNATRL